MKNFIKFGLAKGGGIFIASEIFFILDILILIFYKSNLFLLTCLGILGLYNIGLIVIWIKKSLEN